MGSVTRTKLMSVMALCAMIGLLLMPILVAIPALAGDGGAPAADAPDRLRLRHGLRLPVRCADNSGEADLMPLPFLVPLTIGGWLLLAVTLIGIGVMLWARIDDHRKGLR